MIEVDFGFIARRALSSIDTLLARWLPGGKREGNEYKALNPTRADTKIGSFSINLITGAWGDFAANAAGGDLISLYAYLNNLEQLQAAREVAEALGLTLAEKDTPHRPVAKSIKAVQSGLSLWVPIHPVPDDAGIPPAAHYLRGRPETIWPYRAADGAILGYVYRFTTSDGGKETLPLCYCEHVESHKRDWRWLAFAMPRPLYGLDRLAQHPDLAVLLVEGEKCADVAVDLLPDWVIVTWPGGGNAIDKIDWSPLYGRRILAWADCDAKRVKPSNTQQALGVDPLGLPMLPEKKQAGMKAMLRIGSLLARSGTAFEIVKNPPPGSKLDGWDIADAVAEGMDGDALRKFISNIRAPDEPDPPRDKAGAGKYGWDTSKLVCKNGDLVPNMANVYDILRGDPEWRDILAYNEFSYQVVKLKPPPYPSGKTGDWDDDDDAQTTMWAIRKYLFSPSTVLVADSVESAAKAASFNPVQDYLRRIKWDGTERLNDWVTDYLGAPKTDYIWRVSRWFLMGMVARAMRPGVKFDYCLVLEGEQGRMKSMGLRALGGEWFGDTDLDLHNKDSMSAIRGKWLYELAELGALARSEATKQKSFLSRQIDEFRPVYGRREIRSPRQLVFGGTTNEWGWNKDATGGRRFWPVECRMEVNHKGITDARDQLFAEAFVAVMGGERFWPTSEEQHEIFDPVQLKRNAPDSLIDMLFDWVNQQSEPFALAHAATECLKLDASKLTRDIQTRIGHALKGLNCTRFEKKTNIGGKITRHWYTPPEKKEPGPRPGDVDNDKDEPPIPY